MEINLLCLTFFSVFKVEHLINDTGINLKIVNS